MSRQVAANLVNECAGVALRTGVQSPAGPPSCQVRICGLGCESTMVEPTTLNKCSRLVSVINLCKRDEHLESQMPLASISECGGITQLAECFLYTEEVCGFKSLCPYQGDVVQRTEWEIPNLQIGVRFSTSPPSGCSSSGRAASS